MMKRKILLCVLAIGALVGSVVFIEFKVKGKEEHNKGINIVKNKKDILANDIISSKTDIFEGVTGYDWLNESKVLITKENKSLKPIKTGVGTFEVKNLYLFNLNSKEEKSIGNQSKFQDGGVFSPNKKYIFYRNKYQKDGTGYIVDSQGNTKVKISDKYTDPYDLSEANWINDESLVIPCSSNRGFDIINIDGTINKIKNVEKGIMGTEDPLNGLSIASPEKVGDKIYYKIIHSGAADNDKLKVYDINKKESKELVKDRVLEFSVSPDKKQLFILTYNEQKYVNEIILIDLEGKERKVLDEGAMFGAKWSPDGSKIAYISNEESDKGLYLVDIKTKKKSFVSAGEYYVPIAWSPSSKKIMVHSKKPKNNGASFDEMDITNIITLK